MNYNVQNVLFQIYTKRCNIELVFCSISKTKKIAHLVFAEYMMPTIYFQDFLVAFHVYQD